MIEYKGLFIRENTYDRTIVGEILRTYSWMNPKNENVLDIGGCFGGYSVLAHKQQAKEIYCFEPDEENFIMVKKNCENINNIKIFNSALISGQQKEINFYKTKGINKGNFSTVEFRGRNITTVKSQNFNEILYSFKPSVIKMDCEGSEYDLIKEPLPDFVKKITMEIHLTKKYWRQGMAQKLIAFFNNWKTFKEPKIGEKNWTTIGAWYR